MVAKYMGMASTSSFFTAILRPEPYRSTLVGSRTAPTAAPLDPRVKILGESSGAGGRCELPEGTTGPMSEVIDREALRRKYREERDKRLRPDGNEQYLQPTGRFAHLLDDPYVARVPREPLFDEVTVACIGGGFAGLATAASLKQAGVDDVRIIEKGGDVGGAWYWNRYPGAMCDTAAMIYLPLLEETGYRPTQKYTQAPEILEHCQRIARHFGLYDDACFSTGVTELRWDDEAARWIILTDRGD